MCPPLLVSTRRVAHGMPSTAMRRPACSGSAAAGVTPRSASRGTHRSSGCPLNQSPVARHSARTRSAGSNSGSSGRTTGDTGSGANGSPPAAASDGARTPAPLRATTGRDRVPAAAAAVTRASSSSEGRLRPV